MTFADRVRRIPGVAAAEAALIGARASEQDLAIADYDEQNAHDIVAKLTTVSQHDLRVIDAYEAKHKNRVTITERITALTGPEPWPGYDGQNVADVAAVLADRDSATAHIVDTYERKHKDRAAVLEAVAKKTAAAPH